MIKENEQKYLLTCDICGIRTVRGVTPSSTYQRAANLGWTKKDNKDICAICQENEKRKFGVSS